MKNKWIVRSLSMVLILVVLLGSFQSAQSFQAKTYTLSLAQAKAMALANSDSYNRIKSRISLKEVSYKQAVKSIQLKIKNKTTFRWSPLLSFKFPEKLNFEDESSMVYKPAQIQNEITNLKHDLTDEVFGVYENTEQAFLKVYVYQETVLFEEERIKELEKTLEKNKGRLLLGLATQADVEAIEKRLETEKQKLAQDKKSFENAKSKLSDLINMDISTKYSFVEPYITGEIPRSELNALVKYTLANDQSYYEAKMATQLALLQLDANYGLLKEQYGSKINLISSYIQQVKNGQKIDSAAFKLSYDKFLTEIDRPWQGNWRILFIKIPKEWLKGEIDGVRYIEDEPYALYENALEYQDALAEQKALAKELESQVRENFESVVSARNSYLSLQKEVEEEKEQLQKELVLNTLGELTFEEYTDSQNQYEDLQMEALTALELYNSLLFSFDRLTCGGVSKYFSDADFTAQGGTGGNSYIVDEETVEGARYYIQSIVEDNMFELGIYLPEDFETDVTHYELWVDSYQIGERREISQTIRHLTLSLTGNEKVFIRLYNDEEFVDDCVIDATAYQGPLEVRGYVITEAEESQQKVIGNYEVHRNETIGMVEIAVQIDAAENIQYYSVQNADGANLLSKEQIPIQEKFKYLDLLTNDMNTLMLRCYDAGGNEKYTAYFDAQRYEIYIIETQ